MANEAAKRDYQPHNGCKTLSISGGSSLNEPAATISEGNWWISDGTKFSGQNPGERVG